MWKNLFRDLFRSVALYLIVVVGGTVAFLALTPLIGYSPYGDRPPPGWYGRSISVTWFTFWDNVGFLLGWAVLVLPNAIVLAVVLHVIARVLGRAHVPLVGVSIVMGLLAALSSAYLMAGMGWYIAMGAPADFFSAVLGVVFGALILPRKRIRAEAGQENEG